MSDSASSVSASGGRTQRSRAKPQSVSASMGRTYQSMITESIEEINRMLESEPHKVFPTLRFVKGSLGEDEEAEDATVKNDTFPATYVRLSQTPKEVVRNILPRLEPEKFFDAEFCSSLEKTEKGTLHCCTWRWA